MKVAVPTHRFNRKLAFLGASISKNSSNSAENTKGMESKLVGTDHVSNRRANGVINPRIAVRWVNAWLLINVQGISKCHLMTLPGHGSAFQ